jgi:hypothetical protein
VRLLRPGGRLVLVEYDTDHATLGATSGQRTGWPAPPRALEDAELSRVPSHFLGAIYSAVSLRP